MTSPKNVIRWLADEPFRVFFVSGMLWSIVGVSLWPLYFAGKLAFFPNVSHARLMIEAFGGACVIGFLGTAGPRMAGAPKLTPLELIALFALHTSNGMCHLQAKTRAGDAFFATLLVVLLASLVVRMARFRREWPPPQMLLALTGLLCGLAGTSLWLLPLAPDDVPTRRLAALLLYQGLLLLPVLGIGSFLFPRILGGDFGQPASAPEGARRFLRASVTAVGVVASFPIEACGWSKTGCLLRAMTAAGYLLAEVRWHRAVGAPPRGSLAAGLPWALGSGFCGLTLAGFLHERHVAAEHLLYIGGFGLLILIVGSRVLFGHSGDLAGFARRSWIARGLIGLALLAAATRATADFFPTIMISHLKYAAWTWAIAAVLWIGWHARRFLSREEP